MGFKSDGIRWKWDDSTTAVPPTDNTYTAPAPSTNGMDVRPMQYGWVCPKCGRVNSPWTSTCWCWALGPNGIPIIKC